MRTLIFLFVKEIILASTLKLNSVPTKNWPSFDPAKWDCAKGKTQGEVLGLCEKWDGVSTPSPEYAQWDHLFQACPGLTTAYLSSVSELRDYVSDDYYEGESIHHDGFHGSTDLRLGLYIWFSKATVQGQESWYLTTVDWDKTWGCHNGGRAEVGHFVQKVECVEFDRFFANDHEMTGVNPSGHITHQYDYGPSSDCGASYNSCHLMGYATYVQGVGGDDGSCMHNCHMKWRGMHICALPTEEEFESLRWKDELGVSSMGSMSTSSNDGPVMFHSRHGQSYGNIITQGCKDRSDPLGLQVPIGIMEDLITFKEEGDELVAQVSKISPTQREFDIHCDKYRFISGDDETSLFSHVKRCDKSVEACDYRLKQSYADPHLTYQGMRETLDASYTVQTAANDRGVVFGDKILIVSSPLRRTIETAAILYHFMVEDTHEDPPCPSNVAFTYTQWSQESFWDLMTDGEASMRMQYTSNPKINDLGESLVSIKDYMKEILAPTYPKQTKQSIALVKCLEKSLTTGITGINGATVDQSDWYDPGFPSHHYSTGMDYANERSKEIFDYVQHAYTALQDWHSWTPLQQPPKGVFLVNHQGVVAFTSVRQTVISTPDLQEKCMKPPSEANFGPGGNSNTLPQAYYGPGGGLFDVDRCPCKLEAHNSGTYEIQWPCGYFKHQLYPILGGMMSAGDGETEEWEIFEDHCIPMNGVTCPR